MESVSLLSTWHVNFGDLGAPNFRIRCCKRVIHWCYEEWWMMGIFLQHASSSSWLRCRIFGCRNKWAPSWSLSATRLRVNLHGFCHGLASKKSWGLIFEIYSDILSCLCGSHDLMLLIITYVPVFRGQWREVTIEKPLKLTWLEVLHHHWWKPPRMTSPRRWWWIFYWESSPSHDLSGELWTIIIPHDGSMVLVY